MKQQFRISALLIVFFLIAVRSMADDPQYGYEKIPAGLLKDASAVVRDYHMQVRIVSLNEVYVSEQYAVTVLKEDGRKYARLQEYYDKYRKIDKIKGYLYDKDGNEIKKIRIGDIKDVAPYSYFVEDDRFKLYESGYSVYPYTYTFEIEERYDYSFFLPDWHPQFGIDCAVENADVEIDYPKDFGLRYKTFHIGESPVLSEDGDTKTLKLSIANIAASDKEDNFSAHNIYSLPTLLLAPDKFGLEEEEGEMKSWKALGKFMYDLNAKRDELPAATKAIVHQLTDTCKSQRSKINVLYAYLEKSTRYFAIELGVGGWQTLDANFVAEKGYGDCKALSNYMMSLLKEAGITSYCTLVYAGAENDHPMQVDFPCNQFDHVILCAPLPKDTVWLECTATTLPAGYLSDFTANRHVLVCTPDGGIVVKTPAYEEQQNVFSRNATMHINNKDEIDGSVALKYKGYFCDEERGRVVDEGKTKILNHLNGKFALPTYTVTDYKINTGTEGIIPVVEEQVSLKGTAGINRAGKRLFIQPEIIPLKIKSPSSYDMREKPFDLGTSYCIKDTSTLKIDGAYTKEYLPDDVNMSYPFADYSCKVFFDDNNVLKITRTYTQKKGKYAADLFPDYIKLCKAVNRMTDEDKIVLLKKD